MCSLSHSTMKNIEYIQTMEAISTNEICRQHQHVAKHKYTIVYMLPAVAHTDRALTMPSPMVDYLCLAALTKSDSRVRRKLIFLLATSRHRLLRTQMAFLMPTTSVCTNPFQFSNSDPDSNTYTRRAFALSERVCDIINSPLGSYN